MIQLQLPNSTPIIFGSGLATKITGDSLPDITPQAVNTFCYCDFECEYISKVFADLGSDDYWKNDKGNTVVYRRLISTDTVTIKLFKDGVDVATIIDQTYGDYVDGYPTPVVNPEQELYVSFTIDWKKVLTLLGPGQYQICTELVILGVTTNQDTQKWRLYPYSDRNANQTVRIETYQNGNIEGSEFDFTGLNLYNSYRIPGRFTEETPKTEDNSYLNTSYERKQIQKKVINQWLLKTQRIPRIIYLMIKEDTILANRIEITDYNILNEDVFRRIPVYFDGIDKPDIGKTTRPILELTFADKTEDQLKRNN